jgi:hypothetical protein
VIDYPMGDLMFRPDLSSYSAGPFTSHINPIALEADDGQLELDGSFPPFNGIGTVDDTPLATLVFDVVAGKCGPTVPATFGVGPNFPSRISFAGEALDLTTVDAQSVSLDDTPPVLSGVPADITQPADAASCLDAVVTWTDATATDDCDAAPVVVTSPPSGSVFLVGTTEVTVTATDACGNVTTQSFFVTVTATNAVDVIVELDGSFDALRCIEFVPDDCGASSSTALNFVDMGGGTAVAMATIEIPCGTWTTLCAKDEQHTLWGETTLTLVGSKYVADTPLVLLGGDTDDDGGVDINDVTLFLAQFGTSPASGGCPWDGVTKSADFNNSGTVEIGDYAPLVANWLTLTECGCSSSALEGADARGRELPVRDGITAAADHDRNGVVDWRDVEVLERRHGLSGELSRKMRE